MYTTVAADACTSITIENSDYSAPARRGAVRIGGHRCVLWDIDPTVSLKITSIALLRGKDRIQGAASIPAALGTFDGMTYNFSPYGCNDFLYIVWKSVHAA